MTCVTLKFILDGKAEILVHPKRFRILRVLQASEKPMFVEQIADATKIHPRMVSHHLDVLQDEGLVACRYEISSNGEAKKGSAIRLCEVTPLAKEVMKDIKDSM